MAVLPAAWAAAAVPEQALLLLQQLRQADHVPVLQRCPATHEGLVQPRSPARPLLLALLQRLGALQRLLPQQLPQTLPRQTMRPALAPAACAALQPWVSHPCWLVLMCCLSGPSSALSRSC